VHTLNDRLRPTSVDAREMKRGPEKRADIVQMGLSRLPVEAHITVGALAPVLADVQGLGYREIAEAMGVTRGRVRRCLGRARAKLRDYLRARRQLPPL